MMFCLAGFVALAWPSAAQDIKYRPRSLIERLFTRDVPDQPRVVRPRVAAKKSRGLLDTLFILIFCCAFLFAFLRQAAATTAWVALATSVGFALVSYGFPRLFPPETLNGSVGYLPYVFVLLTMTGYLASRGAPAARAFGLAVMVFCISLTLRTIDLELCARFPLGTHFLWHLLNGYLLWLISREMILHRYASQDG
jgi:hypothetical protein